MPKIYFISDTHFGHKNVIQYCNRPFETVEQMNDTIIKNWNATVKSEDTVFFLGDFGLGTREQCINWGRQLNGHKVLIMGNHDRISQTALKDAGFETIYKKPVIINFDDYKTTLRLSHAPSTETDNYFNVCGHVHTAQINDDKHFCVSVEQINYTPIEITKILEYIEKLK